jgi:DivIVA domain-containing protein
LIHSSAVEGHHFLPARWRGYDVTEVDAVMKRLAATLRKYEESERARDEAAADPVTDLELVRSARDRVLAEAEDLSDRIVAEARKRATVIEQQAADSLTAARREAAEIAQTAKDDAARLSARRTAKAEALITSALSEVKALRARVLRDTDEVRAGRQAEAAAILRTAELSATQRLDDARHEAGAILGKARREHALLSQRIAQLRAAVAAIEGQFRELDDTSLGESEPMAMTPQATDDRDAALPADAGTEPDVVRLTPHGKVSVDLTDKARHRDGGDEHLVVAPGNTIYQRRSGGLRARLTDELGGEPEE